MLDHRIRRPRRTCVGCLLHHPLTVLLTLLALLHLLVVALPVGLALATAQVPALGALVRAGLLLLAAQLLPRLLPVLWRRWRARHADATAVRP